MKMPNMNHFSEMKEQTQTSGFVAAGVFVFSVRSLRTPIASNRRAIASRYQKESIWPDRKLLLMSLNGELVALAVKSHRLGVPTCRLIRASRRKTEDGGGNDIQRLVAIILALLLPQ